MGYHFYLEILKRKKRLHNMNLFQASLHQISSILNLKIDANELQTLLT